MEFFVPWTGATFGAVKKLNPQDSAPHSSELTAENARGARVPPRWSGRSVRAFCRREPILHFFTAPLRKAHGAKCQGDFRSTLQRLRQPPEGLASA
jgi:hypothetical protein